MAKKIVHLTSVHSALDTRIFYKECISLATYDYEVVLVACCAQSFYLENVSVHALSPWRNRFQRIFVGLFQILKKSLDEDADIYHLHDPELILVGLVLKLKAKRVVYDVHEDVPRQILGKHYIPHILRPLISSLVQSIENFSAQRFDALACATPHITQRFLEIGCNAVNINNFSILGELSHSHASWSQKESAVCYVGGIKKTKGIFEIVKAIGQVNAKLLLAGEFTENAQREMVTKLSGWSHVEELGYLNRVEVADVLARSVAGLVILHPIVTYVDSLPVKMFEYMSAGIPVIASDFPLWREIVEGNDCGICVDPLDSTAIGDAITYLIEHPEAAERMGKNARKAVEDKYNWATEANKLKALYEKLLA